MKAVILAAGEGVRLRPLTSTRPKCMLYVAGKPILHHLLLEAKKAGITEAIVVVRYLKEKVTEYFSNVELGMKISFVEQGSEKGTAAALLCAESHIQDTFVVLAGDTVTESSIIRKTIEEKEGRITLAVKKVKNPHEYGVVELSGDKVSIFEEKPKHPKTDLANLSIYCMEPTIFNDLKSIGKSERGEHEIVNLFVGAKAVVTDGYWRDIAYPWDLFEANEFLLEKLEAQSGEIINSTISGKVIMEEGAKIIHSYVEGCSYIGAGTVIGPNAYLRGHNSIGRNCSIGAGSTVKNSILFDNVNAKHLAYIGDSVIGSNVNFGSGTQVANFRFDEGHINVLTEKGWVNTGRKKLGIIVGDNTKFGVLSATMPGKIIGTNCWIHSSVVVNKNVPSNVRVFTRQPIEFAKEE
ncbi:NTP transferase domain-containing protein [Candidatus Micrarchaeota archaeon]|nr:NTP transferase domain-containing protein [Candidatus Micrarchaeota archaeon]MBU1681544.1 NTP transferase domain-containing protein [Candidatus Micrarchaeota archaeon]